MPLYLQLLHLALRTELEAVTQIILMLLAIGLVTAIFQSAFQIEDMAFGLLPKIFAMIAIGMFGGFGALGLFEHFAMLLISHAPGLVRRTWS